MHQIVKPTAVSRAGPTQMLQDFVRCWLGNRRGLVIAGIAVTAAGLASGWGWLSAIGAAPVLLSLAPCLAMCALGLCMQRRSAGPPVNQVQADAPPIETGGSASIGLADAAQAGAAQIDHPRERSPLT